MHTPPNDGSHISHVVDTTTCKKHKAEAGMACWYSFITVTKRFAPAVCGARVKRAGYNGKVSPSSLSQKSGRPNARRP